LPEDAVKYNQVMKEVMEDHGIEINDLFTPIEDHLNELQLLLNVHFNEKGQRALGLLVANAVLKQLIAQKKVPMETVLRDVPERIGIVRRRGNQQ
jgi:lysophospholipase L1-like esterase